MSTAADGPQHADPREHARLGREVQEILNSVVEQAQSVGTSAPADEKRLALHLAGFAAARLSDLADRTDEIGPLCAAVEKELRLAESFLAAVSVKTLRWTLGDEERRTLGAEETGEPVPPRISRSAYVQAILCIVMSIKRAFPGGTARRWAAMARVAAGEEPAGRRMRI